MNGRFRPGVPGNPAKRFQPGTSGNPSGRPKTFSIHQLVAEAIDDKETRRGSEAPSGQPEASKDSGEHA